MTPITIKPRKDEMNQHKRACGVTRAAAACLLLGWFTMGSPVQAQISDWDLQQLSNSLRDAASNFDASRLPDPDAARSDSLRRANELVDFLDRATDDANRDAWLDYLKLEPLVDALESDAKSTIVRREATALKHRLVGLAPGLELTRMQALRESIDKLIPAMLFGDKERFAKLLPKKFNSDAEKIAEFKSVPTLEDTDTASLILGILQDTNQSTQASDAIRSRFRYPNLSVWVGEPVVQMLVSRPVNETVPVRDCILGTSLTGSATMNGSVHATLIPTTGAVGLNVSLTGHVVSRNRGYQKPITLRTTAYGDVHSSRNIYVNETGLSLEPTQTSATLRTEINSIHHRLRIVRRIAWKKALETKPAADRIALGRLRQQTHEKFVKQTDDAANVPIPDLMEQARPFLQRLDYPEPPRTLGSTSQAVYFHTTLQRHDQLAAPVPAPPINDFYDAAMQIHESAVNNSIGYLVAGRTFNQEQMDDLLKQAGMPSPQKSGEGEDEDMPADFEIDFAKTRPIIFEARDGKIRIGISGTRFESDGKSRNAKLEVSANYIPAQMMDGSIILMRDGDVEVKILSKMSTLAKAGMRKPIKKRFDKVFPSTLMQRPITIPQTVQAAALRGRIYRPRKVQAKDGWLTVLLR